MALIVIILLLMDLKQVQLILRHKNFRDQPCILYGNGVGRPNPWICIVVQPKTLHFRKSFFDFASRDEGFLGIFQNKRRMILEILPRFCIAQLPKAPSGQSRH